TSRTHIPTTGEAAIFAEILHGNGCLAGALFRGGGLLPDPMGRGKSVGAVRHLLGGFPGDYHHMVRGDDAFSPRELPLEGRDPGSSGCDLRPADDVLD